MRADSLKEYLSGASGLVEDALGTVISSTEVHSYTLSVDDMIHNVRLLYASGDNRDGVGLLISEDGFNLRWKPRGALEAGEPVYFNGTNTLILEAYNRPGQYIRVRGTTPFPLGTVKVQLTRVMNNLFPNSVVGINNYMCTVVKNENTSRIKNFKRYIGLLGAKQLSNKGQLGGVGSGIIETYETFQDWPICGWCRIEQYDRTLREIVYYDSRTNDSLNVVSRARLGSSSTVGDPTDRIFAVPGIAIAKDTNGIGSSLLTIANNTIAPAGVTWNTAIRPDEGLDIGDMNLNQRIGIWFWREIPSVAKANPNVINKIQNSFQGVI